MFKSILSILGGLAVGVFTIGVVEYLGTQVYPLPASLNHQSPPESMPPHLSTAPASALLLVLLGYALGSFFGGMVASRYAPQKPVIHALSVGVLLLFSGIANLLMLPHPVWFMIAAVLVFLPMAFFGGRMSSKRIP